MDDIDRFLEEDLGAGDVTTASISRNERLYARMLCKERCVAAGLAETAEVFARLGAKVNPLAKDGDWLDAGTPALEVEGSAQAVLSGERTALNIVMRMSGIATKTRMLVEACRAVNPKVRVAATRKTTPGFRRFEKRAVVLGGGWPHRSGLYDMILVKDNHIQLAGGVAEAVRRVKAGAPAGLRVEVEVTSEEEAVAAAGIGVDVIMIDNASPEEGGRIAAAVRKLAPGTEIEASGGITEENAPDYAAWADIVSLGSLTHSCESCDFSLEVIRVIRDGKA
ncbi:MAG: carboxylating nicotinate-nucleotide diphosphorylase [Methanobacteriota archaeon]